MNIIDYKGNENKNLLAIHDKLLKDKKVKFFEIDKQQGFIIYNVENKKDYCKIKKEVIKMQDKKLLELLEDYLLFNDKSELLQYIKNNEMSQDDYKKLSITLLNEDMFDYINCNNFKNVINNIDNDEFLNDENNLY